MINIANIDINAKIAIVILQNNNGNNNNNNNTITNNHTTNHVNNINNNIHCNNNNNNNSSRRLPEPSFRPIPRQPYQNRNHHKKRQDNYYHYQEPSPKELMERVEYDMELEDIIWLDKFNASRGKDYKVSENDFEKIIDALEKQSYFESQRTGKSLVPIVDEDAVCAICNDGDGDEQNAILFCDLCELAVHQECYGVPYIPEGQWLCRRCLQSPLRNVSCVLCPNAGGAFKQTDDNRWAHVICALWIPEVCFANTVFLEPIDNITAIPQARWRLNCYICKQRKIGACIQCHKPNCYQSFHVTCAQQAGLYMKIKSKKYEAPDGSLYADVKKEAFCDVHTPPDGKNGGGMYSGDETDEDIYSEAYRKKDNQRKRKIKKARKMLAEKKEVSKKESMRIKVDDENLVRISKLFNIRGRKHSVGDIDKRRLQLVKDIHEYWRHKREDRSGVPLLRRLQVSYYNVPKPSEADLDEPKYVRLRYDLEKVRLLIGEVKKREVLKRKSLQLTSKIIDCKLRLLDREQPPDED